MRSAILLAVVVASSLTACKSRGLQTDVPALLREPTEASRLELETVVSDALHGSEVRLADDALTSSHQLIIERRPHRDGSGQRIMGRELERPERFTLVISGGDCVLVQESTGDRYRLQEASCVAK